MTNDTPEYDIANIRELLTAAFTAKQLHRFCYDRPTFQPVVGEFAPDHGLTDMVDQVIDHCQTHLLWNELLTDVALVRSRQYARFQPRLGRSAPPPAAVTAAAMATVRTSPSWYWIVGVLLVLIVCLGIGFVAARLWPSGTPQVGVVVGLIRWNDRPLSSISVQLIEGDCFGTLA